MSAEIISLEEAMTQSIGAAFAGESSIEESSESGFEESVTRYEFDARFQDKIVALTVRDSAFVRKTQGLIIPDYFEDQASATLVDLVLKYWQRYRQIPTDVAMVQIIKDEYLTKRLRGDLKPAVVDKLRAIRKADLSDRDFVADKVAEFARHQAIFKEGLKMADRMAKGRFDEIAEGMKKAAMIGVNDSDKVRDYFETVEQRSAKRKDKVAGVRPPQGITTGLPKIDKMLYHEGWGRKELSVLLGGAKAGKSTGLLFFAKNAALAGYHTLYITLEMSNDIAEDRLDACISEVEMKALEQHIGEVEEKVKKANARGVGKLCTVELPGYSLTPSGLRRLLEAQAAEGRKFDLVVIDYLDLMTPDVQTANEIENSKRIYVGVRAIAQEEDIAILSATQSNREGFKSVTVKAEHVADDFNKVRIADLIISINMTEEERAMNEARLYFAASRNQQGGVMIQIKNDLEKMIFIKSVIGVI